MEKYMAHIKSSTKKLDSPFRVRLISSISGNAHTFKFNHYQHFKNWYAKSITSQEVTESDGSVSSGYTDSECGMFDGLNGVIIIPVAGGCNTNKAGSKKMKSSFYN